MKEAEWRCSKCGKLLGVVEGTRLRIKFSRGHDYLVGFPATGVCRGCHSLNEMATHEEIRAPMN